jgi:histidyl-tRNA synthetase
MEKTEVFSRSLGAETDIVNKEMYTFLDKGGESITLRPEMTAAIVRSIIQNNLLFGSNILRLWYFGPLFRYERPQKGRLRQFYQYGAELVGSYEPEADVEIILLANSLIHNLGISNYTLQINSIGNSNSRKVYRDALVSYLFDHKERLSKESQERLERNPLRILDSKDQGDQAILANAPNILNYLDTESIEHFNRVQKLLQQNGIEFVVNPKLVRGLDYYSHTVFEFQSEVLGAQDSFGGGGRYDELFQQFGNSEVPAIGFALGIERIIIILEHLKIFKQKPKPLVFVAYTNPVYISEVISIAETLRKNHIAAIFDLKKKSLKAQLKEANKQNATFALILGDEEIAQHRATLRNMNDSSQNSIPLEDLIEYLTLNITNANPTVPNIK